jgi:hypothetical protein
MKLLKNAFAGVWGLLLLSGCIDSFTPSGLKAVEGLLVVDGTIREGESLFTISRSVGMNDELPAGEQIDQAVLYVESNDGAHYEGLSQGQGVYSVDMGTLNPGLQYRLVMHIDGEDYQSGFLSPVFSTAIDSIFPRKRAPGEPVFIHVATHDDANRDLFYRWTFRETWEVKAELYANARYEGGKLIYHNLHTSNNTYYCWGRDRSRSFLLASTDKLSASVVAQMKLVEIPCDHDKLSILYHIEVEQMQIRKEAYDYFSEMQKNIEHSSDLFSPMLTSGAQGNMHCVNDPERPVVGYIEVATVTKKDLYIEGGSKLYEPPYEAQADCFNKISVSGGTIYQYPELTAPYECVDCRRKANASKDRPLDWPTEHY